MAKRVKTPILDSNYPESTPRAKPDHPFVVFVFAVAAIGVVVGLTLLIVNVIIPQRQTGTESMSRPTNQPIEQAPPKTTTVVDPINISFSGYGQSSTEQFELPRGSYLVKYEFSNNAGTYVDNGHFGSQIECAKKILPFSIANHLSSSGSGSKYIDIEERSKCFYVVHNSESNAKWSVNIVENR